MGIETKLTDKFSQDTYDSPSYRRWMSIERSPWTEDAAAVVSDIKHNQLWRDHLLAIALREHAASPYEHGGLMLVRHPGDQECVPVVRGYQRLLKDADDTLIDMPLDHLVSSWQAVTVEAQQRAWLDAFVRRYLDLDLSAQ